MFKKTMVVSTLCMLSACMLHGKKDGCAYRSPTHQHHKSGDVAAAGFVNKEGSSIGIASMVQYKQGVLMTINVTLPEGERGFHIHEVGDCSSADFKSAGGHFNPHGAEHGFDSDGGSHVGDLPNIIHDGDGRLSQKIFLNGLTLDGVNGIRGKALIIHEKEDDYVSQPTGAAGPRHACAVIE